MEAPSQKISLAVVAGSVVTILAWLVSTQTSLDIPPFIEEAVEVIMVGVVGYWVNETRPSTSAREVIAAEG